MPGVKTSGIEGLRPVAAGDRVFHVVTYTLMLWASLIVVQGFVLGQALLPPQGSLSLFQGLVVVVASSLILALFMSLNGQPGLRYGIPYCIQVRASFGVHGARFPELIRAIPAIVWYGFGTWIAALAMDGIVQTLTGISSGPIKFLYFIAFLTIQTWLAYRGIKSVKWFTVVASVALVLIMTPMLITALSSDQFVVSETWLTGGDWGWPFWTGLNATVGILVAVMVSASDLTRYLVVKQRSMWFGHVLGILPPLTFMMLLGFVSAVTTGVWDPIQALMQLSPNPLVMLLMLAFILIAQFSTNLTVNVLPPAFIFEEIFAISWRKGVILSGILASLTFPWVLLESSTTFIAVINYFTAFFGPLLGCMLAQRWLESGPVDVDDLYKMESSSRYWYFKGFNPAAMITTLVVSCVVMIWWLPFSWLVGMPLGIAGYILLDRLLLQDRIKMNDG